MGTKKTETAEVRQLKTRILELEEKLKSCTKAFNVSCTVQFEIEACSEEEADIEAFAYQQKIADLLSLHFEEFKNIDVTVDCIDEQ